MGIHFSKFVKVGCCHSYNFSTHTHTRREGESSSGSEGNTPTGSATSSRPEFPQVKMHARNQEILVQVLTQDKEKVQHHCGHAV